MSKTGLLYLISAPSGAGKTSLVSTLVKNDKRIRLSVSHTTRPARLNEVNGNHYHFVSKPVFEQLVIDEAFLESADVYGNMYGTTHESVHRMLTTGYDVILEIDWQGARQVIHSMPEAISICIAPPSIAMLRSRLEARGTDEPAVIDRRMAQAEEELAYLSDAKYVIINEDFGDALSALSAIFIANRQQYHRQKDELIARNLLK